LNLVEHYFEVNEIAMAAIESREYAVTYFSLSNMEKANTR